MGTCIVGRSSFFFRSYTLLSGPEPVSNGLCSEQAVFLYHQLPTYPGYTVNFIRVARPYGPFSASHVAINLVSDDPDCPNLVLDPYFQLFQTEDEWWDSMVGKGFAMHTGESGEKQFNSVPAAKYFE